MVPTILIKFYEFIVHSKHNNMTLSAFPQKIRETGKILKFFFSSPKAGPKPTLFFLVFALTLKLRVVHIRKKFKKLIFSKIGSNDLD